MDKLFKKKILSKAVLPLLLLALLFSTIAFAIAPRKSVNVAAAAELSTLGFENNEFENSSGSFPATPTGWTKSTADGVSEGATVSGVLDPATFNTTENKDASKLTQYAEFENNLPQTPFGKGSEGLEGGSKFLMINTTGSSNTAVKYTSSDVTLNANGYYVISAWVRTGNFRDNSGASVRLNGLGGDYAFNKINTVKRLEFPYNSDSNAPMEAGKNLYGWRKFTFYIATSPLGSKTVSLSLGVGDEYADDNITNYASGYAFFDMVEGRELSAEEYNSYVDHLETMDDERQNYYQVVDLSLKTAFESDETIPYDQKLEFAFDSDNWDHNIGSVDNAKDGFVYGGSVNNDAYGLDETPKTSVGTFPTSNGSYAQANDYLKNILIISSFKDKTGDTKNYGEAYTGFTSKKSLTVPMFSYRRLGIWVKTDGVGDSSGADIVLKTNKLVSGGEDDEYREFVIENVTGDENSAGRHGWKEYAFYIQGSSIEEYNFQIVLRLGGSETDKARGTVMFNNIRFDTITSAEFTENSANGTIVSIDGTFANNDSGVTNGAFFLAGDYDEYKYPLAPASWTKVTATDAGWSGYSSNDSYCDYESVVSGIVPTEKDFSGDMYKDLTENGIVNPRRGEKGNLLVISSKDPTAVGYRSSDITLTANTANRLTVTLRADVKAGYGANLILKSETKVLATIENIKTTNGFETFTFYVEGGTADKTVSVELWLGMLDRNKNNNSKLSSGTVFFSQVSYAALADDESYATFKSEYEEAMRLGGRIKSAAYTFKAEDFTAYDYYDEGVVKHPYNWSLSAIGSANTDGVVYGIFDSKNIPEGAYEIPSYFRGDENANNNGVLYLRNVSPTASRLTLDNGYTVAASTYYKLSVTLKADLGSGNADTAIGAGVELTGTDYKFGNILSTRTVTDQTVDNETFKTFEFYILGGSEERTVSVAITLGGSEYTNQYCSGRVYVNDITFTEIDNVQYDDAAEKMEDSAVKSFNVGEVEKNVTYAVKADLTVASDDTTGGDDTTPAKPSFNWWLVPSILFSIALLIAIVGIVVRRVMDNKSKKRVKVEKTSGYDRKNTLNDIHNENARGGEKVKTSKADDKTYGEFDDDASEKPTETVTEEKAEEATETAEVEETTEIIEPAETTEPTETAEQTEQAEQSDDEPTETAESEPVEDEAPAKEEKPTEPAPAVKEVEKEKPADPDPYVDEFDD